jgi:DNA primase
MGDYLPMFYHTDGFFEWTKGHCDKFKSVKGVKDQPRIILPFYDIDGDLFGYQARSYNGEEPKYYKITINEVKEPFYGLERLNEQERIYVVEGPFDSILLPNCVAVASSGLNSFSREGRNVVYIYDNEPRNVEICKLIYKCIKLNRKVCIFPDTYIFKDINEAIQGGMTQQDLIKLIDENTYQGLMAEMKFLKWRKCQ